MKIEKFARSSKGQLKIQEMAFVLVAIMIFFGIVFLFFISFGANQLKENVVDQRYEEAQKLVRKLVTSPEFSWYGCSQCIDFDKIMALKEKASYRDFWNLDYLNITIVYPKESAGCDSGTYPNCNSVLLINKKEYKETPVSVYVALCRDELFEQQRYPKCVLGMIQASPKEVG